MFVHDRHNANVWLIDFAKTLVLPEEIHISHDSNWIVGNHEDGYLIGINNLIHIFSTMLEHQLANLNPPMLTTTKPPDEPEDDLNPETDEHNQT